MDITPLLMRANAVDVLPVVAVVTKGLKAGRVVVVFQPLIEALIPVPAHLLTLRDSATTDVVGHEESLIGLPTTSADFAIHLEGPFTPALIPGLSSTPA